jgi:hypothetical protein
MRNEASNRSLDALNVGPIHSHGGRVLRLPVEAAADPTVWGRIDVIDIPRVRADRGSDPEGAILAADEGLEMVMDDVL